MPGNASSRRIEQFFVEITIREESKTGRKQVVLGKYLIAGNNMPVHSREMGLMFTFLGGSAQLDPATITV
ncbi:MAG: hypothetical protein KKE62_02165 [Proteobacteria bacterium]|nr:hypothetical protein [Pseudomonadota bacterium]MBU1387056.1 hypothetical protein [Pseudomonadota bacterium]MBU1541627.1 hypothetical protein [Pseudomonadota bacterium]MBU2479489.1 hypothetical protein [Pseudomonadota bacterium]